MSYEQERNDLILTLNASYITFLQFFFETLNGRKFKISNPTGRKSHHLIIADELEKSFLYPNRRSIINVPPGYAKSTMLAYWTAWTISQKKYSQFLYMSYSKMLASQHTETIRRIIQLPEFKELFCITIRHDARGKEMFKTNTGAVVAAAGSGGTVTGLSAGLPDMEDFSGALIMDDMHKPDEVHSDTIREGVIQNYNETIAQRVRGINVPQIMIAQRLHERDLCAYLLDGGDGHYWDRCILKALDDAGNALYPEKDTAKNLIIKQKVDIYTFASQFQQDPQPAGGSLYRRNMFYVEHIEPSFICTFITVDTAETDASYNDATVFSFWGLHKDKDTGAHCLHWINCQELRVEPKDLKDEFMGFWSRCRAHKTPPIVAAIEKKSTGVTLISILKEMKGIEIRNIDRNISSGCKTQRFLSLQPYIASKLIGFTAGARHYDMCMKQAESITANNTHAFDDIIDTLYDAVKIALIDKTLIHQYNKNEDALKGFAQAAAASRLARQRAYEYDNHSAQIYR